MDNDGILRLSNPAKHAQIPYDALHPIFIHNNSRLSYLIIHEAHMKTQHGAAQVMIQYIRQLYWIPKLRDNV